ncbi:Beta-ketoacyl synthase, C-terminal domain [Streptomyces sp. Ncost-T6T-2b]|nr:Beta-ketoacyl synthase, C-terminal domain [Streptomyces sp. Ncost-T6T-2b]
MGAERRDPSIAVVGMAFRLPGADTPEDLWRVIRNSESRFTRFTRDDLEAAGVPEELYGREDFIGTSAILDDISGFDARHFGMTAREARLTDPQQRLFLECAQHALENAGYPDERDGRRIGVYASAGYHLYNMQSYLMNNVLPNEDIGDWLAGMQVMVGNFTDFNATRVAYRLGLTGPAINVQTACSSSLVGVQLAANSLLLDECDIALVGSGSIHVPQVLGYHYVKGSILSKTGRLRAFDASADGTVGGTGILAVVLKRLDRALADGDTVHGVIRGWGVCNDGSDKKTFAAPSASGQQKAVRRALDHAGVGADTIGYLETHGTGTLKGDPIELAGASAAYRQDTDRTGYCALGAIKANIGHLDVGAGLAGLVKTLLVLKHGVIPPIAGFSTPNPLLGLESSPFYVPHALRPWPETGTPAGQASPRSASAAPMSTSSWKRRPSPRRAPPGPPRRRTCSWSPRRAGRLSPTTLARCATTSAGTPPCRRPTWSPPPPSAAPTAGTGSRSGARPPSTWPKPWTTGWPTPRSHPSPQVTTHRHRTPQPGWCSSSPARGPCVPARRRRCTSGSPWSARCWTSARNTTATAPMNRYCRS